LKKEKLLDFEEKENLSFRKQGYNREKERGFQKW